MLKLLSLYLSSVTKDLQSRKNFSNLSLTDFIDIPKMVVHEQNLEFGDVVLSGLLINMHLTDVHQSSKETLNYATKNTAFNSTLL